MNIVETLSNVIAEQARKIAELEAFIASKMVVTIAVTKPAESGLGSIAAAHPDVPVRVGGRQPAQPRTSSVDDEEAANYYFTGKPTTSVGEVNLSWSVTKS